MRILALLAALMVAIPPITSTSHAGEGTAVRVMSFNIRYGTADDGPNHWDQRQEFLAETIRAFRPDLLGTQEVLAFQRDYLARQLPAYEVVGVGRDDGRERGEMTAIFYLRQRFDLLEHGHFWLSETPDIAGSKGWDSALPRMVTWVKLRDRENPMARPLWLLNTHFDHQGSVARLEAARLLRRRIRPWSIEGSVVLTGDFNAAVQSPPYRVLFDSATGQPACLVDTYRQRHPNRGQDEGTFHGFRISSTAGDRIDWIGVSPDWTIVEAAIDRTARDGRTPSDHFPVTAVIRR